jgi:hypothetical protein
MRSIRITDFAQHLTFMSTGISIDPDPPCVGTNARIAIAVSNPGPDTIEVERIELKIARFGMGQSWEDLPALGPFTVPADPTNTTDLEWQWTPNEGGHRCVRAHIAIAGRPQPLIVGRNLHVVHSEAEQRAWQIQFRVGNPERQRAPVVLSLDSPVEMIRAELFARGQILRHGEPIWLDPGEEVDAMLMVRAQTFRAIDALQTVRTTIDGRFIDGIGVQIKRPVFLPSRSRVLDDDRVLVRK